MFSLTLLVSAPIFFHGSLLTTDGHPAAMLYE